MRTDPGRQPAAGDPDAFWTRMARPGPESVEVAGRRLRPGDRVRLHPREGGELLDRALIGRTATIEGIDEDDAGQVHVTVTLNEDPGWDLGQARHPGHRFFFTPAELEPIEGTGPVRRVLVAGIGNVFLGDDGFGVAVARRLRERTLPPGVEVVDFGIRGLDLAYAMQQPYAAVILVDALPRGRRPGSLVLVEPDPREDDAADLDAHGMNPQAVLRLARRLGRVPARVLVLGCEPQEIAPSPEGMSMDLSAPVAAAVEPAADWILRVAKELLALPAGEGRAAPTEGVLP